MTKMNNFHGFFPEGYLRLDIFAKNPLVEEIIGEVDRLIDETNFDLERYLEIDKENLQATDKISELWDKARNEGKHIIDPYLKQMGQTQKEKSEMIEPIYDTLISMGYTETQLRQ